MSTPAPPQDRQLPPLAWAGIIGGVLLALVLVTLLAIQLAVLRDSQKHIQAQDAKITALVEAGRPALRDARPALQEAAPLLRAARPLVRAGEPLVVEARAALRSFGVTGTELSSAARTLPPLLGTAEALASAAIPLVRQLDAAALPRVLVGADVLIGSLLHRGRLVRVLDATDATLAEVRSENLIAYAARGARLAPTGIYLLRRLLRVQKATLRTQRRSLSVQATTLDVQREALVHIRSIDRKTGGTVPPTPVAAPAGP
jgi:hypothetical protein